MTWNVLGSDVFGNRRIRNVVPTVLDGGRVVLAGTRFDTTTHTGGVYRSADGGDTWALHSGTGGCPAAVSSSPQTRANLTASMRRFRSPIRLTSTGAMTAA